CLCNDTATTEISTLSLHDALPIWRGRSHVSGTRESRDGWTAVARSARRDYAADSPPRLRLRPVPPHASRDRSGCATPSGLHGLFCAVQPGPLRARVAAAHFRRDLARMLVGRTDALHVLRAE